MARPRARPSARWAPAWLACQLHSAAVPPPDRRPARPEVPRYSRPPAGPPARPQRVVSCWPRICARSLVARPRARPSVPWAPARLPVSRTLGSRAPARPAARPVRYSGFVGWGDDTVGSLYREKSLSQFGVRPFSPVDS